MLHKLSVLLQVHMKGLFSIPKNVKHSERKYVIISPSRLNWQIWLLISKSHGYYALKLPGLKTRESLLVLPVPWPSCMLPMQLCALQQKLFRYTEVMDIVKNIMLSVL